jgi:hypothetical protein
VATADRYLGHLLVGPGVYRFKRGKISVVAFKYSDALKCIGQ